MKRDNGITLEFTDEQIKHLGSFLSFRLKWIINFVLFHLLRNKKPSSSSSIKTCSITCLSDHCGRLVRFYRMFKMLIERSF